MQKDTVCILGAQGHLNHAAAANEIAEADMQLWTRIYLTLQVHDQYGAAGSRNALISTQECYKPDGHGQR